MYMCISKITYYVLRFYARYSHRNARSCVRAQPKTARMCTRMHRVMRDDDGKHDFNDLAMCADADARARTSHAYVAGRLVFAAAGEL